MKVYVLYADNHDYDAMSQWLVGVYSTKEKMIAARDEHEREYNKRKKKEHLSDIHFDECEVIVDGPIILSDMDWYYHPTNHNPESPSWFTMTEEEKQAWLKANPQPGKDE